MNANLQDAELMVVMGDPSADLTAEEGQARVEQPQRSSPASAVCYMDLDGAQPPPTTDTALVQTTQSCPAPADEYNATSVPAARAEEENDSTPRSETPAASDAVNEALLQRIHTVNPEPSYFSPQPLRIYSSQIPRSNPSTDPSPTSSADPSSVSVDGAEEQAPHHAVGRSPAPPTEYLDRPTYQRDLSNTSTTSVATVRASSVDPLTTFTPPSKQRDGPHYPNQSYAALQFQHYPAPHVPPILRSKSSHPAHSAGHSLSHISTFGVPNEHFHNIMDSGSRTVGNSPASSPGLFSPTTPPLRHVQQSDDNIYPGPWLHYTHRQPPKETHVADVDVDPVSGRKLVNHYEIFSELGRGVHGKVKLGRNLEDNTHVAIKIVDRNSKRRRLGKNTSHEDKIRREIAILKKARHPNIVSLLEVIDDPSKKKVYIVLEHVERGEVKWRTEGAKEVCLVEWRRYQRGRQGQFDNESAALEDEKILRHARERLVRQERRKAGELRKQWGDHAPWSFEHGGDSEEEYSENDRSSEASGRVEDRPSSRLQYTDRQGSGANMETAFRSSTPLATARTEEPNLGTELEGTMYGAYDTETFQGRTPSLAGSNSSHFTDGEEEIPEHFHYVPLMTIKEARETFRDTILGLEYLHYQNVIHRDIKPANLLVTKEYRVKISDFGVSYLGQGPIKESNGDQSESDAPGINEALELAKTVGTPAFYAPELCNTDPDFDGPKIGREIDIWALGVTLYCLIYGRVPFHDHNQYFLMRHIVEDEVYIPTERLKPVSEDTGSRPNSHGRMHQSISTSRRAPHDLEYEPVDEDLQDLLRRLLTKDPRHRITIPQIKRHHWLTSGIVNFNSWVEETDPDRSSQGRKIEVSKDDIEKAVVPFTDTIMERVRFGVRKIGDMARSLTRRDSRKRAQSAASSQNQGNLGSAHSSTSTISQEGRRPSLGPGQYIYEALSRSREPEHPLSQSVTASPEAQKPNMFESPTSRTTSPAQRVNSHEHPGPLGLASRPHLSDRAYSATSSAASTRTVRQSDLSMRGPLSSPDIPPALPGTPTALFTPGGSNLGGIFGGLPRRTINDARSRESLKPPHEHGRSKSIDRLVGNDDDPHSVPSLAISTAVASGHVDQPDLLEKLSPTIMRGSSPNPADLQMPDPLERASSRQSSISSVSSRLYKSWTAQTRDLQTGPALDIANNAHAPIIRGTSDERFSRAKDEFVRRRVREENQVRSRPQSATYPRPPSLGQDACPPSPDDEAFYQRQKIEDYLNEQHPSAHASSPIQYPVTRVQQPRTLTSSSSEDHFTSMSQSTSNPSIPSVISGNSSIAQDDCVSQDSYPTMTPAFSGDSIYLNQFDAPTDDPAGYDGDHAVESEDEDSDSDDYLVMGKKKSPQPAGRSESISNAELARSHIRKEFSDRRRSARSGSNGTVKKVPPPDQSDTEKAPDTQ